MAARLKWLEAKDLGDVLIPDSVLNIRARVVSLPDGIVVLGAIALIDERGKLTNSHILILQ